MDSANVALKECKGLSVRGGDTQLWSCMEATGHKLCPHMYRNGKRCSERGNNI